MNDSRNSNLKLDLHSNSCSMELDDLGDLRYHLLKMGVEDLKRMDEDLMRMDNVDGNLDLECL